MPAITIAPSAEPSLPPFLSVPLEPSQARTARTSPESPTAEPQPLLAAAESARLHSYCDLSRSWYGIAMTGGARPGAGWASRSACRRRGGQAPRPGRRHHISLAACALTAPARVWRRHAPMSCGARVRQPEAGGCRAPQRKSVASHVPTCPTDSYQNYAGLEALHSSTNHSRRGFAPTRVDRGAESPESRVAQNAEARRALSRPK